MDEFNILQLEKLGIIIELLGDVTFIKALNLEEIQLMDKKFKKHKIVLSTVLCSLEYGRERY